MKKSKKQGQRLIPEYLLDYAERLEINHPDPTASWSGETYTAGYGIDIDDNNAINVDTNEIATIDALQGFTSTFGAEITAIYNGTTTVGKARQDGLGRTFDEYYASKSELFSGDYNDLTNKPTIPTKTSELTNDSGYITGITSSDVTSALGYTPGTSNFSGDYNDLTNKPTIPTVNDATITLTQGGVNKGSFTLNQSGNQTIDLDSGGSSVQYVDYTNNKLVLTDGTNNFEVSEPLVVEQKIGPTTWTGFYKYDCYLDITNMPTGFRLVDGNDNDITTLHTTVYRNSDSYTPTFSTLPTYAGKFDLYQSNPYYITDGTTTILVISITRYSNTVVRVWFDTSETSIGGTTMLELTLNTDFTFRYDDWKPFDTTSITSGTSLYANTIQLGKGTTNGRLLFKGFQTGTNPNTFVLNTQQILVYTNDGATPITSGTITNYANTNPYATMSDDSTFTTRTSYSDYSQVTISTITNDAPIPNEYKITCNIPQVPTRTTLYSNGSFSLSNTALSILDTGKTLSDYDEIHIQGLLSGHPINVIYDVLLKGTSTVAYVFTGTVSSSSGLPDYCTIQCNTTNNTLTIVHSKASTLVGYIKVIGINY